MRIGNNLKLGVNIDHIATLRQARREMDPDPAAAALVCKRAGADMIVAHLRQDRRHIQESDVFRLCRLKGETHLEIASVLSIISVVMRAKPDSVCLVPENPREVTTSGGLNLKKAPGLARTIKRLKDADIEVSLFIDPDAAGVRAAKSLGVDAVELCTRPYAEAKGKKKVKAELERLELAGYLAYEMGMNLHAGHGLDYHNVQAVARIPHITCLNIGFSIIARAVFAGLKGAVAEMKLLIS